jgi:hypothetical protein
MPEPFGNRLGTDDGPVVPSRPLPEREGLGNGPTGTATSNPYGMTDAEFLDALGPSWNHVAPHRREFHPGYRSAA